MVLDHRTPEPLAPNPEPLLIPQRHHRIDPRRPPGRQVASHQRRRPQQQRHGGVGQRVHGPHAEEQSGERAGDPNRHDGSDDEPRCAERPPLGKNGPHQVPWPGSECQPDPEFVRAPPDREGQQAVQPDARQRQCQGAEA